MDTGTTTVGTTCGTTPGHPMVMEVLSGITAGTMAGIQATTMATTMEEAAPTTAVAVRQNTTRQEETLAQVVAQAAKHHQILHQGILIKR